MLKIMPKTAKIISSLVAGATLSVSTMGYAYEAGDWLVRVGLANVSPSDSSSVVNLNGADLAGTGVGVEDDSQLGLTLTYMLSQRLGLELLVSTPFEHEITATGIGANRVGTAKHLPPTLSLQYYLLDSSSTFQPYIGAGVNYTKFFSEDASPEFEAALGNSKISLDDSLGVAVQVGADFALNEQWGLNAAVWKIDLDTTAEIQTDTGPVNVDVDIDPWVYMVGVTYKF